jgi:hypothetical protein
LRSFELKLAWAKHQSQVLENEIALWHNSGGYGVVFDQHPHRAGYILRLKVGDVAPEIPLIIGDALHALRSSLDHLAHDLSAAFTDPLPPEASQGSEFPIFGTKAIPEDVANRKLGWMDRRARTVIEALQPYVRGDAYADDPLWHLYDLARIDRHRFVHLTVAQYRGLGIGGDNLEAQGLEIFGADPTAGDGTELGYVDSVRPIDPGRPMQMNVTPNPDVVFKEGTVAGKPVLATLDAIRGYIETEVVATLQRFLTAA